MIPKRLAPLIEEASELAERFSKAGRRLYLVGGTVRDAISDLKTDTGDVDLDFTTDASPDEAEGLVRGWADAVWLQGKRFGTVGFLRDGRRNEITTHRAEVYRSDSRKPTVRFAADVQMAAVVGKGGAHAAANFRWGW